MLLLQTLAQALDSCKIKATEYKVCYCPHLFIKIKTSYRKSLDKLASLNLLSQNSFHPPLLRGDKSAAPRAVPVPPSWGWATWAGDSAQFLGSVPLTFPGQQLIWTTVCLGLFPLVVIFFQDLEGVGAASPRSSVFSDEWEKVVVGRAESVACVRKPFCELHITGSRSVSLSACFHQPCSSCSHLLITRGWHPAPFSAAIPVLYLLQARYDPCERCLSPGGCQQWPGPRFVHLT